MDVVTICQVFDTLHFWAQLLQIGVEWYANDVSCVIAMSFALGSNSSAPADRAELEQPPRQLAVSDEALDSWANEHLTGQARDTLARVGTELRRKALRIVMERRMSGNCHNPSQYVQGIVRKELSTGPYPPPAVQRVYNNERLQARAPYHYWSPDSQRLSRERRLASERPLFYDAERTPKEPPQWVTEAMEQHMNGAAVLQTVAAHISPDSLQSLSSLPSSMQIACALSMLVSVENWSRPEHYIARFVAQSVALHPRQCGSPCTRTETGTGHEVVERVAVVLMGSISGAEWQGAAEGLQRCCCDGRGLEIVDRVHVTPPCDWQPVLDEVNGLLLPMADFSAVSPPKAVHLLAAKGLSWAAQSVTVLCLCFGPPPEATSIAAQSVLPGYHGRASRIIWRYIACIRTLQHCHCPMAVAHINKTQAEHVVDAAGLTRIFGEPWTMESISSGVPKKDFVVRCSKAKQLDKVALSWSLGPFSISRREPKNWVPWVCNDSVAVGGMPSSMEVEGLLKKEADGEMLSEHDCVSLSRLSVFTGMPRESVLRKRRLCKRDQMASIFGCEIGLLDQYWTRMMPCDLVINCVTGIPAARDHPEAVPCGQSRWCRACGVYYDMLRMSPGVSFVKEVVARLIMDAFSAKCFCRISMSEDVWFEDACCGHGG